MRIGNDSIITDGAMDADITSEPIFVGHIYGYSIHAVWADGSTPIGKLKIEVSNDYGNEGTNTGITNWFELATPQEAITGDTGSCLMNVTDAFYRWIRVIYDATSGNGTLNVRINTKGI